ncbi:MAG: DNA circularization N-terminal domain-containing protein [Chloroflexota bacterium]|jgi:hypothetical protein
MNAAPVRPMIDDFELPLVQLLHTEEDQVWVEHGVPRLEGSLFQHLGRAPTRVRIEGVIADDEALDKLEALRQLYQAADPVTFAADIMTATEVQEMVIDELFVRELAGKPQQYYYTIILLEYVPTPEEPTEPGTPPNGGCTNTTGDIEITVVLPEGQTDFSGIVVRVQRTDVDDEPPFEIAEQENGKYSRTGLTPGQYRATAIRRSE